MFGARAAGLDGFVDVAVVCRVTVIRNGARGQLRSIEKAGLGVAVDEVGRKLPVAEVGVM